MQIEEWPWQNEALLAISRHGGNLLLELKGFSSPEYHNSCGIHITRWKTSKENRAGSRYSKTLNPLQKQEQERTNYTTHLEAMPAAKRKEGQTPLLKVLFTSSIILPTLLLRKDALLPLMFPGEGKAHVSGDMTAKTEDNSNIFKKLLTVLTAWLQSAVLASLFSKALRFHSLAWESSLTPEE